MQTILFGTHKFMYEILKFILVTMQSGHDVIQSLNEEKNNAFIINNALTCALF